jgi:putative ABC transport system substrate-binding protein
MTNQSTRRGIRRREFIAGLGAAGVLSIAADAQPTGNTAVLGFLAAGSPQAFAPFVAAFQEGLKEAGFVDGQNLTIEYRWAEGRYERLPALADELVRQRVTVLASVGGDVSARAAKAATSTIPIVFATADDPVATGLVASLSHPAGNLTGVTWRGAELRGKNLELVHELLPALSVVAVLLNPKHPNAGVQLSNVQEAARTLGKTVRVLPASNAGEIETAFVTVSREKLGALIINPDPMFAIQRAQIVDLAARRAIPTVYFLREFVVAGGLMSYGSSLTGAYKLTGSYAGRLLQGAKPADLPIQQSTRIELVLNLKTAKSLGLTVPNTLLGRADEVIE